MTKDLISRTIFAGGNHSWVLQKRAEKVSYNSVPKVNTEPQLDCLDANQLHSIVEQMSKNTNPSIVNVISPDDSTPRSELECKVRLIVNVKRSTPKLSLHHLFMRVDFASLSTSRDDQKQLVGQIKTNLKQLLES